MQKLCFFENFKEILRLFENFIEIFAKIRKNLEKFLNIDLSGAPRTLAKILKISPKINGNQQYFENFHEFLANFDWKRLILIKIKASLLDFENL